MLQPPQFFPFLTVAAGARTGTGTTAVGSRYQSTLEVVAQSAHHFNYIQSLINLFPSGNKTIWNSEFSPVRGELLVPSPTGPSPPVGAGHPSSQASGGHRRNDEDYSPVGTQLTSWTGGQSPGHQSPGCHSHQLIHKVELPQTLGKNIIKLGKLTVSCSYIATTQPNQELGQVYQCIGTIFNFIFSLCLVITILTFPAKSLIAKDFLLANLKSCSQS